MKGTERGRCFAARTGALAIVAATTVGFAVGDALATPHADAATIAQRSTARTSDWSWSLATGRTLEIEGVNGWVRATRASGAETRVHAVKTPGRRGDPDQVAIEVIETAAGVTLCVHYPDLPGREPNRCGPGGHSHMSTRDEDTKVDFTVELPAGVRLEARSVNGSIEARGLDSDLEASTVNGSVWIETRGAAGASTVNGSVHARVGRLGKGPLAYSTVNGGVTLELPDGTGAEISAHNVNGAIESDFRLDVRRTGFVGREMSGTIGAGGPRVKLSAVNGRIQVLRAGRDKGAI